MKQLGYLDELKKNRYHQILFPIIFNDEQNKKISDARIEEELMKNVNKDQKRENSHTYEEKIHNPYAKDDGNKKSLF